MEYLINLDLFAWRVAQNQSENNNGVYGDEKWAACLFHTDRVVREAIASGAIQPVEMTMGYHVNLTDPGAVIKLSELADYGRSKGFWWGDLPTMAKSLGFDVEPQALPVVAVTPEAAPVQKPVTPAPVVKRTKRKTWRDVALDYVVGVYSAEQYATAKDLFKALQNKAGAESPFDVGTGENRGNLFVRDIGKGLALGTLENAMPEIKAAKK